MLLPHCSSAAVGYKNSGTVTASEEVSPYFCRKGRQPCFYQSYTGTPAVSLTPRNLQRAGKSPVQTVSPHLPVMVLSGKVPLFVPIYPDENPRQLFRQAAFHLHTQNRYGLLCCFQLKTTVACRGICRRCRGHY